MGDYYKLSAPLYHWCPRSWVPLPEPFRVPAPYLLQDMGLKGDQHGQRKHRVEPSFQTIINSRDLTTGHLGQEMCYPHTLFRDSFEPWQRILVSFSQTFFFISVTNFTSFAAFCLDRYSAFRTQNSVTFYSLWDFLSFPSILCIIALQGPVRDFLGFGFKSLYLSL